MSQMMTERASETRGRLLNRSPEVEARRQAQVEHERRRSSTIEDWSVAIAAPPVQRRAFDVALADMHDGVAVANHAVWGDPLPAHLPGGAVQLRARMAARATSDDEVRAAAARGTAGSGGAMPYADTIQAAFGRHDISGVRAHTDGAAADASQAIGAMAYASGERVAFAGAPDLFTAAHEAAHVVQQRAGVHLSSGVGRSGDVYERHADEVASLVVSGHSAEAVLDRFAGGAGATRAADGPVQRLEGKHDAADGNLTIKHAVPLVEAGYNLSPLMIPYVVPPMVKPPGVNLFAKTAAELGITVGTGAGLGESKKTQTISGALDGMAGVLKGEVGIDGGFDMGAYVSGLEAKLYGKAGLSLSFAPGKDVSITERKDEGGDGSGWQLRAALPVKAALSVGVKLWEWDESITLASGELGKIVVQALLAGTGSDLEDIDFEPAPIDLEKILVTMLCKLLGVEAFVDLLRQMGVAIEQVAAALEGAGYAVNEVLDGVGGLLWEGMAYDYTYYRELIPESTLEGAMPNDELTMAHSLVWGNVRTAIMNHYHAHRDAPQKFVAAVKGVAIRDLADTAGTDDIYTDNYGRDVLALDAQGYVELMREQGHVIIKRDPHLAAEKALAEARAANGGGGAGAGRGGASATSE